MPIEWIDVTIPMRHGMTAWPGDTPFAMRAESRIGVGDECNVSKLTMSTHTGTHVDAPWHFEDDGKKLDEIDTSLFFGEARVLEIPDADVITADALGDAPLPRRLLLKTRNSRIPLDAPFEEDFVALAPDAAQRLVDEGVQLVGVDYYSVAPYQQPGQPTHHILLQNDVLIVEGLVLKAIEPGQYQFVVLPLALVVADGAPCRAFIGKEH